MYRGKLVLRKFTCSGNWFWYILCQCRQKTDVGIWIPFSDDSIWLDSYFVVVVVVILMGERFVVVAQKQEKKITMMKILMCVYF